MDWSVYDMADRFTLHDAGFLLIDLPPLKPVNKIQDGDPHETDRQAARCITDQLIFDAKNDQLKVQNIEGGDGLKDWKMSLASSREGRFISLYTFSSRWFVHRNDLMVWAESKGKRPAFLFDDARDQNSILPSDWPNHTTPEIELLKKAISEFWENHKPERPPKRDEIVTWLLANSDISKSTANAIDLIIRPPYAKKGGNKKLT